MEQKKSVPKLAFFWFVPFHDRSVKVLKKVSLEYHLWSVKNKPQLRPEWKWTKLFPSTREPVPPMGQDLTGPGWPLSQISLMPGFNVVGKIHIDTLSRLLGNLLKSWQSALGQRTWGSRPWRWPSLLYWLQYWFIHFKESSSILIYSFQDQKIYTQKGIVLSNIN